MNARFAGAVVRATRKPDQPYPLSADQVKLARAMAGVLIDAAKRTGAPFHQGDLVIKRYVSSSHENDLLCILGNHDTLTHIVEYARSLGADETAWTESGDGQTQS